MAGSEADIAGVRTPGASGQTSAAGTTNKLRESCQACALSKVKCPKEKPTCSRRDTNRRQSNAGVSTKSTSSIDTENGLRVEQDTIRALQPSVGACFLSPSITPPAASNNYLDMSPQTLSIPESPRPDHVLATEASDVFSVLEEANMFSALADFDSDGNGVNFMMSSMDSPFGLPIMDSHGMTEAHNDIGSLLIPPQGINIHLPSPDISYSIGPISATSRTNSFAPDVQVLEAGKPEVTRATDTSSCGCLTQSLDLLKTLSAQPATQTGLSVPESQDTPGASTYGCAHSVLTENKQSIEAVSERLTCRNCAGDNFLLAILSMTVLKILERYAAAARAQSGGARPSDSEAETASRLANGILASSKDQMAALSHTYNTPRNRGRRAAQLVLSELHRVQRLVNQLSPKLKRPREAERRDLDPELELWGRRDVSRGYDPGPAAPFSATTLGQMESDVRRSLSALSSEIINGLRQS
ncbi:hypothetical protein LA080_012235 [Diaporthe eres]|nr:hypothetical protein LA080_012235 [Diaporthe eres]